MKKALALLLSILLVFLLCSCENKKNNEVNLPATNPVTFENEQPSDTTDSLTDNTPGHPSDDTAANPENSEASKTPGNNEDTSNEQTPTLKNEASDETTTTTEINKINSHHNALKKEQYYQYSYLSDTEKAVYNEFFAAAEKCKNTVDLSEYKLTEQTVQLIYDAFCADCPQFFYISKYCTYSINSSSSTVTTFIFQYTDGEVTDTFSNNNTPLTVADREKINNQTTEFNQKISAILSLVSADASELEKEQKIYEYITDTVTYDNAIAEALKNNSELFSHSFSAYGAACKGKAVCEGYTKLMQYLCYNLGINATPVESGKDMQHMWIAVEIDNCWYMSDITWDDTDNELSCSYKYFNVTTAYLSRDHSFSLSSLKVPHCDSEDASFYNNYAIIPSDNNLPENYKDIIKNSDKYIYIYRGDGSIDLKTFISEKIYSGAGLEYINSLGLSLGNNYSYTGTYYYIPITKN